MKTIISKDLSSTLSPTADQLVKVAADGEWFVWVPDLSHSHTNKALLDQITSNPVETIVAWLNVTLVRVGNTVTIASSEAGSSGFIWIDPDINNLTSLTTGFLFADKRSSAHTYNNTSSGIVSTNVQWAIDEVEARVDTAETSITTLQTDVGTLQWDVTALQTSNLETVSDTNSIDLTKTGVNVSADLKLDASSNNLLSVSGAGTFADERAIAHTYDPTASGLTATNVQAAIDEVEAETLHKTWNESKNGTLTFTWATSATTTIDDLWFSINQSGGSSKIASTALTWNRVHTLQNKTGTLAHLEDISGGGLVSWPARWAISFGDIVYSGIDWKISRAFLSSTVNALTGTIFGNGTAAQAMFLVDTNTYVFVGSKRSNSITADLRCSVWTISWNTIAYTGQTGIVVYSWDQPWLWHGKSAEIGTNTFATMYYSVNISGFGNIVAVAWTVSGWLISLGTPINIQGTNTSTQIIWLSKIDSWKFVSFYGWNQINLVWVTGNTCTSLNIQTISWGYTSPVESVYISSGKSLITMGNVVVILTLSGITVSESVWVSLWTTYTGYALHRISNTQQLFVWSNGWSTYAHVIDTSWANPVVWTQYLIASWNRTASSFDTGNNCLITSIGWTIYKSEVSGTVIRTGNITYSSGSFPYIYQWNNGWVIWVTTGLWTTDFQSNMFTPYSNIWVSNSNFSDWDTVTAVNKWQLSGFSGLLPWNIYSVNWLTDGVTLSPTAILV